MGHLPVKLLPDDLANTIVKDAVKKGDLRDEGVRDEITYLADRCPGVIDIASLNSIQDNEQAAVQDASNELATGPPESIEIRGRVRDFWARAKDKERLMPTVKTRKADEDHPIAGAVVEIFRDWLSRVPHPDEKRFYIGSRSLSAREIVAEVEAGSDLGIHHVKMMMDGLLAMSSRHANR